MSVFGPLQSLVEISDDIHADLLHYLPSKTSRQLQNHEYKDPGDIYLNESVVCVSKTTGLLGNYGKVIKITEDILALKQGCRTLYVPLRDIYLFKKLRNSSAKNDRDFYEALLTML